MPLLPIDLQTIFAQLPNVGREQAVQRDATPLQQVVQGQNIVQSTYQQDRSVNQPDDSREGEAVKLRDEEGRRGGGKRRKKEGGKGEGVAAPPKEEVFRDPALGSHIDVVR